MNIDSLGPIVINKDGTLSRVTNWETLTEPEKCATKRMLAKRNLERRSLLESTNTSMSGRDAAETAPDSLEQKILSKRVVADPISPDNEVSHSSFPAEYRVIKPGTLVTRDMREDRLNIHTDENDKVTHTTMG